MTPAHIEHGCIDVPGNPLTFCKVVCANEGLLTLLFLKWHVDVSSHLRRGVVGNEAPESLGRFRRSAGLLEQPRARAGRVSRRRRRSRRRENAGSRVKTRGRGETPMVRPPATSAPAPPPNSNIDLSTDPFLEATRTRSRRRTILTSLDGLEVYWNIRS